MPKLKKIVFVDFFAGAGGVTEGVKRAAAKRGIEIEATAVNHWPTAIKSHSANHPGSRHFCTGVDNLNVHAMYKPGEVDFVWFSPECIFFSRARGGKPVNDQRRASAWCVPRIAEAWLPKIMQIENVPEFVEWAPLVRRKQEIKIKVPNYSLQEWLNRQGRTLSAKLVDQLGKRRFRVKMRNRWLRECPKVEKLVNQMVYVPDENRKGEIFNAWVTSIRALGYRVEWRTLIAANYGSPTTRERLFVYCVRENSRMKIRWPEPTHARQSELQDADMFSQRKPWRSAREHVIDWSYLGSSIWTRQFEGKKPLVPKTMNRIFTGVNKFCGLPFVLSQQTGGGRGVNDPVFTVTATAPPSIVSPFLVALGKHADASSIKGPCPSICAGGNHVGVATPFLIQTSHGNGKDPNGDKRRVRSINEPVPTIAGQRGDWAVVQPFVLNQHAGGQPRKVEEPVPTITGTSRGTARHPIRCGLR